MTYTRARERMCARASLSSHPPKKEAAVEVIPCNYGKKIAWEDFGTGFCKHPWCFPPGSSSEMRSERCSTAIERCDGFRK